MSLQISEKNGMFHLNGKINAATLKPFLTYFEYNLSQSKNITVNINKVIEIDRSGLDAIKILTQTAFLQQKTFSITGYGCKEIYDDFNEKNVN